MHYLNKRKEKYYVLIHFVCEENKSNGDGRFLTLRSSGRFDEYVETTFFDIRFRDFFRNGGHISPNWDVISSIIDWSFRLVSIAYDGDECDNGGVRRFTIEIEFDNSLGHDDDKQGEITDEDDSGGINEQVESVWSIVSRLMIVGDDENDEVFCCIDDDEHKQWPSDVIVLNSVKRIGIWEDDVEDVNELRRSESFNNRSFEL
jgi:hypothetical protein